MVTSSDVSTYLRPSWKALGGWTFAETPLSAISRLNWSPESTKARPLFTELQQQIHDDLRIQHPEWVEPNGECPTCDSYESRLTELLDTLTRRGSNESIAATHRVLEQGLN